MRIFGISLALVEFSDSAPLIRRILLVLGIVRFIDLLVNVSEDGVDRSTPSWLDEALKSAPFIKIRKVTCFNASSNHEEVDISTPFSDTFTMRYINLTNPKIKRILLVKDAESPNSPDA